MCIRYAAALLAALIFHRCTLVYIEAITTPSPIRADTAACSYLSMKAARTRSIGSSTRSNANPKDTKQ